jgi:hypothetical protein
MKNKMERESGCFGQYKEWEVTEGKLTKVKIGDDIFVKEKQVPVKTRMCPECKESKPLAEYYILKKTGKPAYLCKECHKKSNREHHKAKREKEQKGTEQKQETVYKAPDGYKMVYAEVKTENLPKMVRKIKEQMPGITDADIMWKDNRTGYGLKTIYVRRVEKKVVQEMNSTPEIGIVDATKEDVIPLVDSCAVIEDKVDEPDIKKKWFQFKSKK